MINNNVAWLVIKPEAEVFLFKNHEHLETYYFEKFSRFFLVMLRTKKKYTLFQQMH